MLCFKKVNKLPHRAAQTTLPVWKDGTLDVPLATLFPLVLKEKVQKLTKLSGWGRVCCVSFPGET